MAYIEGKGIKAMNDQTADYFTGAYSSLIDKMVHKPHGLFAINQNEFACVAILMGVRL